MISPTPVPTPNDRPAPRPRSDFPVWRPVGTRWADNDIYGHVNNVVYYSLFDTAVNGHLIDAGALDIHQGDTIGLVVETQCRYFEPVAFPQRLEAGLKVARIGRSSVRYEVGLYVEGEALSAAHGHFIHVYVDRTQRRPVTQLPTALLATLQQML